MTTAIVQTMQETVAECAQRDALARAVMIAWVRKRDRDAAVNYATQTQAMITEPLEETNQEPQSDRLAHPDF